MKKEYIPVLVMQGNKQKIWYIDISNMNISQLLMLRKSLVGVSQKSISVIDGIIKRQTPNINYREKKVSCREYKKVTKEEKMKRKRKERKQNSWRNKIW